MKALSFDIGLRNLGVCKLDVDVTTKEFSIGLWEVYSAIPADLNINKTSIEDLCPYFSREVLKHRKVWLESIDICYIESQPMGRTRNLKTKVLSHILQILLLEDNPDLKIQFIHPTLKLKNMVGERSYRANKKFAILETETLIAGHSEQSLFVGKKKDDLADCFLQGFYACWTEKKETPKETLGPAKKGKAKAKTLVKEDPPKEEPKVTGKRKGIKNERSSSSAKRHREISHVSGDPGPGP